jgi:hypothetical protein
MPCATAKSAQSEAISMKAHPERADGDIETEWEKNYGDEKDWAQVGTNGTRCPQDGTCYSQNRAEGGTRCPQDGTCYSQNRAEGGTRCPQDSAKA